MTFLKIGSVFLLASLVVGCAFTNATYRSLKPNENGAQMLVWHPDYSAGVGRNDRLCVQGARTATASTFNAAIDIAQEANGAIGYGEAVRALNPSNPQVTFASNAYFAICQLAINDSIDPDEVPALIVHVTNKALEVDTDQSEGSVTTAPQIVDAITQVLTERGVEVDEELEGEIEEAVENATGEDVTEDE